jgi:hypothetical protein
MLRICASGELFCAEDALVRVINSNAIAADWIMWRQPTFVDSYTVSGRGGVPMMAHNLPGPLHR